MLSITHYDFVSPALQNLMQLWSPGIYDLELRNTCIIPLKGGDVTLASSVHSYDFHLSGSPSHISHMF